eukprot:SRR837773.20661.p1 GENE.SRR837773.20661~~SRR837773.20661.p1  ORF type:complete len:646 (+),score=272.96 SRR837773.20661:205-1938(+)
MTAGALREIEQKKSEVETKKEELAQFQWQVVVDQITQMAKQVATLTAQLQGVKDDCTQKCQKVQQDEANARERMEEAITRETQQREVGLKDIDVKIDKLVQAICSERSARDVAVHQLGAQIAQAVQGVEADRALHVQERAQTERALSTMKHQVEAEAARNEEQWNWHLESAKRLDSRLEEATSTDMALQVKVGEIESSLECLKATAAALESTQASHGRTVQEMMTRRGEELSKAVRDEMLGRENHISRFAKELETSWQSLEARLQRSRDEATKNHAAVSERTRVLENRCAEVEKDLSNHVRTQSERDQVFTEKVHNCIQSVDTMEMALKSSDVVTQSTVSRVDDIMNRLVTVEDDLQQKVSADYWQPQMDALQRADTKMDAKISALEKEMLARFSHESAQRDGVKAQLQDSMKSCMEKIASVKPKPSDRFIEVEPYPRDEPQGLVTPRCAFGSPITNMPQVMPTSSAASMSASVPPGSGMAAHPPGSALLPVRAISGNATPGMPGDKQVVRQISLAGSTSPSHARLVGASPIYHRAGSPQVVHPGHAMPVMRTMVGGGMLSPRAPEVSPPPCRGCAD